MPGKHQHFQDPEIGCCGKYFLFGFNIVFWVLGALFLAIGLWAWGEKGVLSNISALTDLGGLDPVWLFVVVGGVMSVLGFAGCIGALRENTFLLKFFSVFLGLIFFLELATGILAFVFKDWIRDQLNLFINNNVKAYRDDIDLQNLIDFAQEYWSCCGARGPNDWNLNIYFNCTDLNPSRERCGVPFSCCVRDPAEDVLNTQCGYDIRLKLELEQQGSIHTKGCVGQFEKWLQDNLIVVAGVLVGIALLQIFGICLAQNLMSDIKAVKANWITHGDGYKLLNKQQFENHWLMLTAFEGSIGSAASTELSSEGPGRNPTSQQGRLGLGSFALETAFEVGVLHLSAYLRLLLKNDCLATPALQWQCHPQQDIEALPALFSPKCPTSPPGPGSWPFPPLWIIPRKYPEAAVAQRQERRRDEEWGTGEEGLAWEGPSPAGD